MIPPGTRFEGPLRIPIERIVITEHQARYPDRVMHYVRLLTHPAHAEHDVGILMLTPHTAYRAHDGDGDPLDTMDIMYTILDGHHRFYASCIAGRHDVLALVQYPPEVGGEDYSHVTHGAASPQQSTFPASERSERSERLDEDASDPGADEPNRADLALATR